MTNFIPIFPLELVVYPGEELNLHIFEPRYKQLIQECHSGKKAFGIPTVLQTLQEFGSLVEITELSKVYDNGEMDIKTKGIQVFRVLEVVNKVPDKLYYGAIVNYPENRTRGNSEVMSSLLSSVRHLHRLLKVAKSFKKEDHELTTYDLAHHVGLSLEEEYEFLTLLDERQRQEYLKRHLAKSIPTVAGMEELKEKIKLNGHFKNPGKPDINL